MNLEDVDRELRRIIAEIPETDRSYILDVLTSDAGTRAKAIGSLCASGLLPTAVELLIDAEEEPGGSGAARRAAARRLSPHQSAESMIGKSACPS
jgi:hypothetical protein